MPSASPNRPEALADKSPRLDYALDFNVKARLGGLGVFVLFVLLRWNMLGVPLVRDEGEYLYAAQLLKHGLLPYEHSFLQKPPMVAYSYLLANGIAPGFFSAPRFLAYLFEAFATCLLGLIARFEFGRGFALPTMWVVTPLLLFPSLWQFTANTEMFLLLPLLGTFAVYTYSRRRGGGPRFWFWAGALATTTLLYKYTAVPVLAALFLVWSVEEWRAIKAHLFPQVGAS